MRLDPGEMLLMVSVKVPVSRTSGRNAARPRTTPSVGGIGPENSPVAGSSVGSGAFGLSTVPSVAIRFSGESRPAETWADGARGVTARVIRADSSDVGPDLSEFTSNAVTA